MPEAVDFYAALGTRVLNGSPDGDPTLLELNFVSSGPLTKLEEQLRWLACRLSPRPRTRGFGRQLQVASPDRLLVKLNELDAELYR